MSDYVTSTGFAPPSLTDLLSGMNTDLRAGISPLLNTEADSPIGQITGIVAGALAEVWEVASIAFDSHDPSAAEDWMLDNVSAITGTRREPATPSRFDGDNRLRLDLDAGTIVPVGSVVYVDGDPDVRFVLTEGADASAGAGYYMVAAECETLGPVACNAGTLTEIATPISGWNAVINLGDAVLGTDEDTDTDLRLRREAEIRAQGSATTEAIRAALLAYEDADGANPITLAIVYENTTTSTDGDGRPAHSIEALLFDGFDEPTTANDLAQVIFDSKAGGVMAYGTDSGFATDSLGTTHLVGFSRPSYVTIHVEVEVETNVTYEGDTALRTAITTEGNLSGLGGDVIYHRIARAIMGVAGVLDIVSLKIDNVDPPINTGNFSIGVREMAKFLSANIDVTS